MERKPLATPLNAFLAGLGVAVVLHVSWSLSDVFAVRGSAVASRIAEVVGLVSFVGAGCVFVFGVMDDTALRRRSIDPFRSWDRREVADTLAGLQRLVVWFVSVASGYAALDLLR